MGKFWLEEVSTRRKASLAMYSQVMGYEHMHLIINANDPVHLREAIKLIGLYESNPSEYLLSIAPSPARREQMELVLNRIAIDQLMR